MQILRLLAARRAASASTTGSPDDEGPFFDLHFSSVRGSSFSSGSPTSGSGSDSDSDDSCAELDFIISLQRSHSASPLDFSGAPQLKFCASEPPARASSLPSQQHAARKRGIGSLRSMSFGARKAAPLHRGRRPSFAWTSSGRNSCSSGRSLRHSFSFATEDDEHQAAAQAFRRVPSRDVIRRCLARISRRLRTAATSPRAAAAEARAVRRLRKCRSSSSLAPRPTSSATARSDDSAAEKQDGIAGAIAHCKDSLHRASPSSESGSPLLRSRSDPGNREAA